MTDIVHQAATATVDAVLDPPPDEPTRHLHTVGTDR
jgi:hypothetical protein